MILITYNYLWGCVYATKEARLSPYINFFQSDHGLFWISDLTFLMMVGFYLFFGDGGVRKFVQCFAQFIIVLSRPYNSYTDHKAAENNLTG